MNDGDRHPAHRPSSAIDESGQTSQVLAAIGHAQHVVVAPVQRAGLNHDDLRLHGEQVAQLAVEPSHRSPVIELGLDNDLARDDVQSAGEAEHGGDLRAPLGGVLSVDVRELILDGHCQ